MASVLAVVALGNLVLPEDAQESLGVDYLYLAAGVLGLLVLLRVRTVLLYPKAWAWSLLILLSALPVIAATGLSVLGTTKLLAIVWIAVLALAVSAFVDIQRGAAALIAIVFTVGVVVSLLSLLLDETTVSGRGTLFALNPIGVSRVTGLAVVVAVIYALYTRRHRVVLLAIAALCASATAFTLSRGPLLSAFAGLSVGLLLLLRNRRLAARWLVLLIAAVLVFVLIGVSSGLFPFGNELLRGDSGRSNLFDSAWQQFVENQGGIGWGNFYYTGDLAYESDDSRYPHNLFLEVASEGGWVALLAMFITIAGVLVAGIRTYLRRPERESLVVLVAYIYALVNAQVSSDIAGNRMLWVFMALTAGLAAMRAATSHEGPRAGPDTLSS